MLSKLLIQIIKPTSFAIVTSLMLLLSGCSGSKKILPIIEFTSSITPDHDAIGTTITPHSVNANWKSLISAKISSGKIICQPLIADNIVYTLDNKSYVAAYDYKNHKMLWKLKLAQHNNNPSYERGGMALQGNLLYVTYGEVYVVAIDTKTGYESMRAHLTDIASSKPVVREDIVLVQTNTNQLLAFTSDLTAPLWRNMVYSEPLILGDVAHPLEYQGVAMVSYNTGHMFAVDLNSGDNIWQVSIDQVTGYIPNFMPAGITLQPIIDGNFAFVVTSNELIKFDLTNATIAWRKKIDDIQNITFNGNTLFVTNNARQVAALRPTDGGVIWATRLIDYTKKKLPKPTILRAPLVINNNLVVLAEDGYAYELNPQTGALINSRTMPQNIKFISNDNNQLMFFYNDTMLMAK